MKGGTYEVFSFIGFAYRIKTDEQRFTGRTDGYFVAGDRFSQRRTAGCRDGCDPYVFFLKKDNEYAYRGAFFRHRTKLITVHAYVPSNGICRI